ncbi:MAG: electron transfer flavoprotein subunit alpha/FixB family protein [Planctomycetes bacterium]|nr:electron transfer flavoprotein subunit alpha/FixB family protein [Planctomycetota bacterium]
MDNKGVWILAEQSGGRILRISHELLTRGRTLADKRAADLTAVVFGNNINEGDLNELIERGADRVLAMEAAGLEHFLPEPYSACLMKLIGEYRPEIMIAGATSAGRTLMPLVAVKATTGLTADCTGLDIEEGTGNLLQTRPAIGGNIMATIKTPRHRPQMATVRPHSTKPAIRAPGRKGQVVRLKADPSLLASRVKRVDFVKSAEEHGLADADVIVAVGRGIKKGENLKVVQPLVSAMDAALGASRDVVDRGWLSYPHQIGLSGKTVSPKLYFALGVSGSIQHLAGMQTSETVVAVNTDPEAQIFRVADVGIVGNLFDVVPVLIEKLKQAKKTG